MNVPYTDAVGMLNDFDPPVPDWCAYGLGDGPAKAACQSAHTKNLLVFETPGDDHGMNLLTPEIMLSDVQTGATMNALEMIQEFLGQVLAP